MAKCDKCGGSGEDKSVLIGIFPRGVKNYGPCPACNGTGEAAELTADQAAKVIFSKVREFYTEYWEVEKEYRVFQIIWVESTEVKPPTIKSFELLGKGDTFTAALNAAARAVKERGKA